MLARRSQRCFRTIGSGLLLAALFLSGRCWLVVVSVILVQSMLTCPSQRCFLLIGAGLSLAALVRLESIDDGPSLEASFRIVWCWPIVGGVGLINRFPTGW